MNDSDSFRKNRSGILDPAPPASSRPEPTLHAAERRTDFEQALIRSLSLLIDAVARDAVRENEEQYLEFQRTIRGLEKRLAQARGNATETLALTGAVVQAMIVYNRAITQQHATTRSDFHIGTHVVGHAAVQAGASGAGHDVLTDSVTHLPDRRAAREALAKIFEGPPGGDYGVCLRLDRLSGINSTCGYETGNEYLALTSRLLSQALPNGSRLFRWSGPGFFAVVRDKNTAEQLQRAVGRLNSARDGHELSAGARSIVVGIAISSTLCAIRDWPNIDAFTTHVDGFISKPVGRPLVA